MNKEVGIIIAAGSGSRLLPLTDSTPKPLIPVYGKPMIETNIEAMQRRSVGKIYIVVGYKKEQFDYLKDKYKNVVLVENNEYNIKNNMSSIFALGNILGSSACFISDSDLYIRNQNIYQAALDESCFFAKYIEEKTNEWFYETVNGKITCLKKGGKDGYNMADISYWTQSDALRLNKIIAKAYADGKSDMLLWEQIVAKHFKELNVGIHEVKIDDIIEIDTFEELCAVDSSYIEF